MAASIFLRVHTDKENVHTFFKGLLAVTLLAKIWARSTVAERVIHMQIYADSSPTNIDHHEEFIQPCPVLQAM